MLLDHIEWIGEKIRLYRVDVDGSHEEIDFTAADAHDLLGWLLQERHKIEALYEKIDHGERTS